MELDEWLDSVPVLALRAFAEDMPGAHSARRERLVAFVLEDGRAREVALASKSIEDKALAR